jgi:hypothetical protein
LFQAARDPGIADGAADSRSNKAVERTIIGPDVSGQGAIWRSDRGTSSVLKPLRFLGQIASAVLIRQAQPLAVPPAPLSSPPRPPSPHTSFYTSERSTANSTGGPSFLSSNFMQYRCLMPAPTMGMSNPLFGIFQAGTQLRLCACSRECCAARHAEIAQHSDSERPMIGAGAPCSRTNAFSLLPRCLIS